MGDWNREVDHCESVPSASPRVARSERDPLVRPHVTDADVGGAGGYAPWNIHPTHRPFKWNIQRLGRAGSGERGEGIHNEGNVMLSIHARSIRNIAIYGAARTMIAMGLWLSRSFSDIFRLLSILSFGELPFFLSFCFSFFSSRTIHRPLSPDLLAVSVWRVWAVLLSVLFCPKLIWKPLGAPYARWYTRWP